MDAGDAHWVYADPYGFDVLLEVSGFEPERVPAHGTFPIWTRDGAPPGPDGWCIVKDARNGGVVQCGLIRLLCLYAGPTETPPLRYRTAGRRRHAGPVLAELGREAVDLLYLA